MYVIYKSTMFAQIQEYISQVPKHILIGVALVVVGLVGFSFGRSSAERARTARTKS